MRSSDNTNRDLWHREFCPWMRNRVFLSLLYLFLLTIVIYTTARGVYLAFTSDCLLSMSNSLGLPVIILYLQVAWAVLGVLGLCVLFIFLSRQESKESVGWIILMFMLQPVRLIHQATDLKVNIHSRSSYLLSWWTETTIALIVTTAIIGFATCVVYGFGKHRNLDNLL